MNTLAFILALGAIVSFILAAVGSLKPRVNWLGVGLALLTAAWIAQLVLQNAGKITMS